MTHVLILILFYRVEFSTFDILEDEEVRQGLKKFSNWPTYPQLYVNGELIGGLDIVRVSDNRIGSMSLATIVNIEQIIGVERIR